MRLYICPKPEFYKLYVDAANAYNTTPPESRDSGFDLFCDVEDVNRTYSEYSILVGQACTAVAIDANGKFRAYWLAARSSISKTPWSLANSMGLIDATYRGTLKAALRYTTQTEITENRQRLVQLVRPDLLPWDSIIIVETLPGSDTARGAGGFGSTGF
jgi:dUTP pyrophosphatase